MTEYDQGETIQAALSIVRNTSGQDLVIHAPCATAQGDAAMNSNTEPEEAGDGLD